MSDHLLRGALLVQRYNAHGELSDLDAAIESLERCVESMTIDHPRFAFAMSALGETLVKRYARTRTIADLERGIDLMEQAITVSEEPAILINLTLGLMARYHLRSNLDDLDRIIALCERAIETSDGKPDSAVLNNLGLAYRQRYLHTGDAADLDRALAAWEKGLELTDDDPRGLTHLLINISAGSVDRFHRDGALSDLDAGIRTSQQAIELTPPAAPDRPVMFNSLAVLFMERYNVAEDLEDLRQGVQAFQEAVDLAFSGTADLPMFLMGLGTALTQLYDATDERDDLDYAIEVLEQGVELTPEGSPIRARHLSNLAAGLSRRGDHDRAIALFEEACAITPSLTPEHILFGVTLAEEIRRRWSGTQSDEDLQRASHRFLKHLQEGLGVSPRLTLLAALKYGQWAFERRAWSEVVKAHEFVRDARERVAAVQIDRREKSEWLKHGQGFTARAAYAHAMTGDLQGAIVALELGRARLLAEALGRDSAGVPWNEIASSLSAQADGDAIVYLMTTTCGALSLIAFADEIEAVWSDLDTETLTRTTAGFVQAQFEVNPEGLASALDELLPMLGAAIIAPLAERLRARGIRRLVLIPTGRLGLLPLHAARYGDRCLLDDFVVRHAPSLRSLAVAQRAASRHTREARFLLVGNPSLEGAEAEVEAIEKRIDADRRISLRGTSVTQARVLDAIGNATHLHFACHGEFDPREPLASFLELSDGERLTLRDFIDRRLRVEQVQLAVLSACQTALTDFASLPDEVIGLPAGFFEAGVRAVIATLWAVDDEATAQVMIRFYELMLREGQPPAEALGNAQRWLRDSAESAHAYDWAPFVYAGA